VNEFFYRHSEYVCRMGTNCAPLLTDLFLYSHKADSMQELLKKQTKIARSFNFMLCYIKYVLLLNNNKIGDVVDRIYSTEL